MKAMVRGGVFALASGMVMSLIMTTLLYFEIIGPVISAKVLYGAFILILLMTSFIAARIVGSRGLLIGLGISSVAILLTAMYRLIGVEAGIGLSFLIRSVIISLVACAGAVVGVNTSK